MVQMYSFFRVIHGVLCSKVVLGADRIKQYIGTWGDAFHPTCVYEVEIELVSKRIELSNICDDRKTLASLKTIGCWIIIQLSNAGCDWTRLPKCD